MNLRAFLLTAFLLSAGQAGALTVAGSVEGSVPPDLRVAGVVVSPFGQVIQEVASVPVTQGRFTLELPSAAPSARAQAVLTPQNVTWPGVIDPVQVSAQAQVAELKFFTYRDVNNNGRRDENEALREVTAQVRGASLFVVWVNTDVTVTASKGFQAPLRRGWNAFLLDVGRVVKVQPFADSTVVTVRVGR
ncbi:hypothetical protein LAJ19_06215 [Deinococcus taeanensis]|uniref:hypothetical protein n=1 Tax=Deinococcus taeanensis TaxID=2737050 RepID=UPI001CDBB755|nr:hypothetical protein [Deinococcus taeanensis]UBV43805.1 hypothetical protein LAJ19_06215 [Deinococcus taeanensis]